MKIRGVTPPDRAQWLEMRKLFWPDEAEGHAGEIDRFLSREAAEPQAVLVAEEGGEILGFVELSIRPFAEGCITSHVGYVEGWFVKADHRGEGVGRALIDASEAWARGRGCTELASDTGVGNRVSTRAHLACGFEEVGTVRCFRKPL